MQRPSFPTPTARPTGQSAAAAVLTGAAMGAIAGATVTCSLLGAIALAGLGG